MRKVLFPLVTSIFILLSSTCGQAIDIGGSGDSGSSTAPVITNIVVLNTATTVLAYDTTRLLWTIHPENGSIRCTSGTAFGAAPADPTSTTGMEFTNGGYFSNYPLSTSAGLLRCISESGTSVNVSVWADF